MKSLSFTGYFILNLLFALVLSVALSLLIIPPYSPNIENLLAIASESGQIQATAVWADYLSQKHELAYQLAKKRLVAFSIVFLVLIPVCWRVVTRKILPDSLKKNIKTFSGVLRLAPYTIRRIATERKTRSLLLSLRNPRHSWRILCFYSKQ